MNVVTNTIHLVVLFSELKCQIFITGELVSNSYSAHANILSLDLYFAAAVHVFFKNVFGE